jgi:hypothetical protein
MGFLQAYSELRKTKRASTCGDNCGRWARLTSLGAGLPFQKDGPKGTLERETHQSLLFSKVIH